MLRQISNTTFLSVMLVTTGIYYGFMGVRYARFFREWFRKRMNKARDG